MVEVWVFGKFTSGAVDCGVGFWVGEMELFLANLCLVWFCGGWLVLWGGEGGLPGLVHCGLLGLKDGC